MSYTSDPKETCLLWRENKNGTKTAYFRKKISGKDKWQSLGELAPEDARAVVRKLRRDSALEDIEKRLGYASKRSDISTFAELFKAYDAYCAGIDIEPNTVKNNRNSASLIVRRVMGGGFDVDAARVSVFTAQLLRDFSAVTIAARKAKCAKKKLPEEEQRRQIESAQRTIRSTVRQARSLFARAALSSTAYQRLSLPDLSEAMRTVVGESSLVAYEPPPAAVVERIAAEAAALKAANPGLWLALNLEINAGLRRGSARFARWEWFSDNGKDRDGNRWVDLRVLVSKGGESIVRFDAGLYEEMLAVKADGHAGADFILPGATVEDRDALCKALVPWLRERGLDRRQPNHELRKLYGDQKYREHGATEAQRALGHSDSKLTSKVYASARSTKSLRVA
ncbi:MAG: hypothetical protein LBI02_07240 [Opitutaceae bacterium]|jgi:integrase|nr:hypothetical protein [Opitutaceae bacterium]